MPDNRGGGGCEVLNIISLWMTAADKLMQILTTKCPGPNCPLGQQAQNIHKKFWNNICIKTKTKDQHSKLLHYETRSRSFRYFIRLLYNDLDIWLIFVFAKMRILKRLQFKLKQWSFLYSRICCKVKVVRKALARTQSTAGIQLTILWIGGKLWNKFK